MTPQKKGPAMNVSKRAPNKTGHSASEKDMVFGFCLTTHLAVYWPRPVSFDQLLRWLDFVIADLPEEDFNFQWKFCPPDIHHPRIDHTGEGEFSIKGGSWEASVLLKHPSYWAEYKCMQQINLLEIYPGHGAAGANAMAPTSDESPPLAASTYLRWHIRPAGGRTKPLIHHIAWCNYTPHNIQRFWPHTTWLNKL